MPRYTDPDTGKTISSSVPLNEDEIAEGLGLANVDPQIKKRQLSPPLMEFMIPETKKNLSSMIRPLLEGGGALAGGTLAAPFNLIAPGIAEALGVSGGYLSGKYMADILEGKGTIPSEILTKDIPNSLGMAMFGPIVSKGIGIVAKGIGAVTKPTIGRLTGVGGGAVEEALSSGAKLKGNIFRSQTIYDRALRGKITGEEIVDNAKSALQGLKDQRAIAYQERLARISNKSTTQLPAIPGTTAQGNIIDPTPIAQKTADLLKSYNVKATINPKTGKLDYDLSRIAMGKAGRNDIKDVINIIKSWGTKKDDYTLVGLDSLKRQLDDFYSESSQARQFVVSLRKTVHDTITKTVPEYGEMTKGYSEATTLIKDIESGLMLRKQGMSGRIVADQTLRRLISSMKDNFALRRDLVNVLGEKGNQDLGGQIAGYAMRSPIPLGIAGTGPVLMAEAAAAKLITPKLWPILAVSSPRLEGEFLRLFGKALFEMSGVSGIAGKTAAYGLISSGTQSK